MRVTNTTTGAVLAHNAGAALTAFRRAKGLLGTRWLPEGSGLLIKPCNSVHMLGMRYSLHIVYLDSEHRVLWTGILRPWRFGPLILGAREIVELPPQTAGLVRQGDVLAYSPTGSDGFFDII